MRDIWQRSSIGDLFEVQLGKMLNKAATNGPEQREYLTNANVRWGHFDLLKLNRMHFSAKDRVKFRLKSGDLIVCEGGEVGRCAIWHGERAECYYQKALHRLRPVSNSILPEFAYHFFQYGHMSGLFSDYSSRSSIAHLTREKLLQVPIPLPTLPTQRKITAILRTWDEAIEKFTKLRTAKNRSYQALARSFFDPCYPAFHGRPNTWRDFELGEVFHERSQSGEDGDKLLSITMADGVIDREAVGRKDTSTEDKSKYKLILPEDIGYNTMRMWQGVSGLSGLRGIVSPAYTIVTPVESRILGRYAAHLFRSHRMVFDFQRYSQGLTSDTWSLKFPAFSKIRVFLPPVKDQEKQANLLDAMIDEYTAFGRQLKSLTLQKRGLMQKLLTGEWIVDVETS